MTDSLQPHRLEHWKYRNGSTLVAYRLNHPQELEVVHMLKNGNLLCKTPGDIRLVVERIKILRIKRAVEL